MIRPIITGLALATTLAAAAQDSAFSQSPDDAGAAQDGAFSQFLDDAGKALDSGLRVLDEGVKEGGGRSTRRWSSRHRHPSGRWHRR